MNETNNKRQVLRRLFFSTLYLSAFTFGGGYVIVTLLKKKFVDEYHWIEEDEMLDLVAIAQSAPGAIAVNGAIVVGYKLAGMPYEAFRDNFLVSQMLTGMQAGVGAVIASVVWQMGADVARSRSAASMLILAAAFAATCLFGVNVVVVILAAAGVGAVRTLLALRHKKEGAE